MKRAYATLDIKAVQDATGKRLFTGIASTPAVDRMGDIVEPDGAEFQLPIPLLWQHDSRQPIGWITEAKVTPSGITVGGEVADVPDPGTLKDRLLEAWQSMTAKLVRGLSIGFDPIEYTRIADTYSYRYVRWSWLELSCVTIPANADASITSIKSADMAVRRALSGARPIVRINLGAKPATRPGVSGTEQARHKGAVYLK
jgi:HK97 family phage prohead protease